MKKQTSETTPLSSLVGIYYGKDHKQLPNGTIPVFGSGGIMRYVDTALYNGCESILIPRKGTLNNILYVSEPFWSVDTMFYTKSKKEHCCKFLYLYLRTIDFTNMNVGSAVPSMTTKILNSIEVPNPGEDKLRIFDLYVQPMFDEIKKNREINNILKTYRNSMMNQLL